MWSNEAQAKKSERRGWADLISRNINTQVTAQVH